MAMTKDGLLPAEAAIVLRAIRSQTTCTASTSESLKVLLIPPASASHPNSADNDNVGPKKRIGRPTARPAAGSKVVNVVSTARANESTKPSYQDLSPQSRLKLATEVLNLCLKELTQAARNAIAFDSQREGRNGCLRKSSSSNTSLKQSPCRSQSILQPLDNNQFLQSPRKANLQERRTSGSLADGLRAQAVCARVSISALRSLQNLESFNAKFAPLQLEKASCALITKFLTLGFEDIALKELRILKRRIELASTGGNGDEPSYKLKNSASNKAGGAFDQAESIPSLLNYSMDFSKQSMLDIVITSQIQSLKILAAKGSERSIEAALEHLRLDVNYSPGTLLERLSASTDTNSNKDVQKQYESLIGVLQRIKSRTFPKRNECSTATRRLSVEVRFQLQCITSQLLLHWWSVTQHQPDLSKEMFEPFKHSLRGFQQQCKLENDSKYVIARQGCEEILHNLKGRYPNSSSSLLDIMKIMADLAMDCDHLSEALRWTRSAFEGSQTITHGSLLRATLTCQLAYICLAQFRRDGQHHSIMNYLQDAILSIQAEFHGDALAIDEFLVVVVKLRKEASLLLHEHRKDYKPHQLLCDNNLNGRCTKIIFACIHLMVRYLGRRPDTNAPDQKISRHYQRTQLLNQLAPSTIQAVLTIARVCINEDRAAWKGLEVALVECSEICLVLDNQALVDRGSSNRESRFQSIYLTLSQIFWGRYLYASNLDKDDKDALEDLQRSIDALKSRSVNVQTAGQLVHKLERYATLLESRNDFQRARKQYQEIIRLQTEAGVLLKAVEISLHMQLSSTAVVDDEIKVLDRVLLAYLKMSLKMRKGGETPQDFFYDDLTLCAEQRALVLQRQFESFIRILFDSATVTFTSDEVEGLTSLLLDLYADDRCALHRLSIANHILRLSLLSSDLISETLSARSLRILEQMQSSLARSSDGTQKSATVHLIACGKLYSALKNGSEEDEKILSIVSEWCRLVTQFPEWDVLQSHVCDVENWIVVLDLVSNFASMTGNDNLKIATDYVVCSLHQGMNGRDRDGLVRSLIQFGVQYIRLGYSGQAGILFSRVEKYLEITQVADPLLIEWWLAKAEFALECGNMDHSQEFAGKAQDLVTHESPKTSDLTISEHRRKLLQFKSCLSHIKSKIAMEQGLFRDAMHFARMSVQYSYRLWAVIERRPGNASAKEGAEKTETLLANSLAELSLSEMKVPAKAFSKYACLDSFHYWTLTPVLLRNLLHLSRLFADCGLLMESIYYLGECEKIASAVGNPTIRANCQILRAQYAVYQQRDTPEDRWSLRQIEQNLLGMYKNYHNTVLYDGLIKSCIRLRQIENAKANINLTRQQLEELTSKRTLDRLTFQSESNKGDLALRGTSIPSKPVQYKKPSLKSKRTNRRKLIGASHNDPADTTTDYLSIVDSLPLRFLQGHLARQAASVSLLEDSPETTNSLLQDASILPVRQVDTVEQAIIQGSVHYSMAMKVLSLDAVLSVASESAICCPAIRGRPSVFLESGSEKTSQAPRQASKGPSRKVASAQQQSHENSSNNLLLVDKSLRGVLNIAQAFGSTSCNHSITDVFASTLLTLSAVTQYSQRISPDYLSYILEIGRVVAMDRELMSIDVEQQTSGKSDIQEKPMMDSGDARSKANLAICDFDRFQSEYVDIIPPSWTVISMTLSKTEKEIWINKIRSGRETFVLRLPFTRENAMESEGGPFDFQQGKAEMADIILNANISAHNNGGLDRKGAKTDWWNTRVTLDARLGDLLANIENIWFGGFRGVFSSHLANKGLLARFHQSFRNILDKHLPSRRKPARSGKTSYGDLDSNVLELLIGLGDPKQAPEELDDHLLDLLYFVVDILQFNGERNAYDEIDFDAIVIEALDAIEQYYHALSATSPPPETEHTILILDKNLHSFPWESLPCLAGRSISRVPSLGCLKKRLSQIQSRQTKHSDLVDRKIGFLAAADLGAYVLNPGGDLVKTQAAFENILRGLDQWQRIVQRKPSECEMKEFLQDKDVFLYFGHGNGGQYIRSRTIKKFDSCAVSLLMGCSSGTLMETGDFEPYGTPITYMHAGCPALLATLWDVTDKDIDRFSSNVLEKWGLIHPNQNFEHASPTKKSSKRKGKEKPLEPEGATQLADCSMSLNEAVAKSRDVCFLRYLNGAAPVIYGIPVYLH